MNTVCRLMLVTQRGSQDLSSYLNFIKACAANGITAVQLREKNYSSSALFAFAQQLKLVLTPYHIPLIVNDNLQLAQSIGAAGDVRIRY